MIASLRPLPPFQSIREASRVFERDGQEFIELPYGSLETVIRCFLRCVPFDERLYLQHYPSLRTHSNPYLHWVQHGYFEGRLVYGWERLPFDLGKELLEAPDSYFELVQRAAAAAEDRCYRSAERCYEDAIAAYPPGVAARIGLADLLFRLRRSLDSEAALRHALERAPDSPRANELLIDVLVDVGQHDLACAVSLDSGRRANTSLQVLRLLSRGDLHLARRQARLASDDWPTLQTLRQRIKNEWQEVRQQLTRLHALVREAGNASVGILVAIAVALAKLGFANRSRIVVSTLLTKEANRQELWSSVGVFLSLVEAVRINDGAKQAFYFMNEAPTALLAMSDVLVVRFKLAYQAGERGVTETLFDSIANVLVAPEMLEMWCHSLMHLRRFDEAIRLCRLHWPSVAQNRWLPSVVLQIGRIRGQYHGVALDEDAGEVNFNDRIPRRIMQFWDRETPPEDVRALIGSWPERNPGFEHVLFSNESAIAFLRDRYDEDYVRIFEYCHHPVMKADFFRLAYLAAVGGTYVDADEYCNTTIEDLIFAYPARDLFASLSETGFFVNNRFLCSSPQHPFLLAVLQNVAADMHQAMRVGKRPDIWHTTGPSQYSKVFAELLMAGDEASHALVARIGLVYSHELGRYLSSRPLNYKATKEGNWRAQ